VAIDLVLIVDGAVIVVEICNVWDSSPVKRSTQVLKANILNNGYQVKHSAGKMHEFCCLGQIIILIGVRAYFGFGAVLQEKNVSIQWHKLGNVRIFGGVNS